RQHRENPLTQVRVVASLRVLKPRELSGGHRALPEGLEYEVVEVGTPDQIERVLDPGTREPRTGANSRLPHQHAPTDARNGAPPASARRFVYRSGRRLFSQAIRRRAYSRSSSRHSVTIMVVSVPSVA